MRRYFFIIFFIFLFSSLNAYANIDVVYPRSPITSTGASKIFIFGNTDSSSKFYINSNPVPLWNNNFFVQTYPLNYGENIFVLKSVLNGKEESKTYIIKRIIPKSNSLKPPAFVQSDGYLYAEIIKENATVREKPTINSKRIVDLPKDIVLFLCGKQGDYYKIAEKGETQYWIHKSNIEKPISVSKKITPFIKRITKSEDKLYNYTKFELSFPAMYKVNQINQSLVLTIYGIPMKDKDGNILPNFKYQKIFDKTILGYDCYYERNVLILRDYKIPHIKDKNHPLKGINIFVDAGHGGIEKGAVGPTRVNEKDINLAIANYLIKLLKESGANVSYSRTGDLKIGLYERVRKAQKENALISISIHNNSLPDGKDPYLQHGTEVHYYNENAKELASIIQKNMSKDLKLKDNGIKHSSFALNRSTNPISVLIECAYMINPNEYISLQNPDFQYEIAKSIKKSIENYIISLN